MDKKWIKSGYNLEKKWIHFGKKVDTFWKKNGYILESKNETFLKRIPEAFLKYFLMVLRSTLKYTLRCKPLNVSRQWLSHKKWTKREKKEGKKRKKRGLRN